jgi:ATP-dependent Lon protease
LRYFDKITDLVVSGDEFIEFCVNPAVRMRQQIRDELAKLDQEYRWVTIKSEVPDEFQLSHPDKKPEPQEETEVDPLSPDRKAIETSLDIADGQRGISYAKLFAPYLSGAKAVKLIDPYIRYDYQIHNFVNFCECLAPGQGELELTLVTGADSGEHERILAAKFDELKSSLEQDRISFTYSFKKELHDRWIETDTGWRILLGRGLDIFQKPEGKFTLGFVDQTKRQCKATTVTYARSR